ncbi:MAG: DUF4286 family protein [Chitinophagales bacterium]|jgi:hypothetical protein|nr:DUF4286 family protein [Chitinophagales bacterium]
MLVYNVTVKIDKEVEAEWLEWMKNCHIPDVLTTGQFITSRMCKLIDESEDEDPTYVIQYHCQTIQNYNHYINKYAPALREEYEARYKNKFVAFRTLMEVVE